MVSFNRVFIYFCILFLGSMSMLADELVRTETRVDSVWNVLGYKGDGAIFAILETELKAAACLPVWLRKQTFYL